MNEQIGNGLRSVTPSNAVVKAIGYGTPASIVFGYVAGVISVKYKIPLEVATAGLGMIVSGITASFAYFARGGRRGESQ